MDTSTLSRVERILLKIRKIALAKKIPFRFSEDGKIFHLKGFGSAVIISDSSDGPDIVAIENLLWKLEKKLVLRIK